MNELLDKLFKWDIKDLIKAIIGCFLFAFAVNIFLVPNSLYNGGILGIAQLIRSLFINVLHKKPAFSGKPVFPYSFTMDRSWRRSWIS